MNITSMRQRQRAIFLIITFILAIYLISFRAKRSSKQLTVKPDLLEGFVSFLKNSADKEEKATLIKTLQFMLEERDAENEELVEFVRSLIHKPFAGTERNLNNKERTDFSQIGQSRYIDGLLASQRDGFYVEAGGFDGEAHSNSLFFELNRNWTGILIEPSKKNFKKLIAKKRRIYALNACITDRVVVGKFRSFEAGDLSGLEETMSEGHLERGESQLNAFVPCFSLLTILKAINVAKVDYFSLDVEGAESHVLRAIDFSKLDIRTMTIEHNGEQEHMDAIVSIIDGLHIYKETKRDAQDIYYVKL